MRCPNCIKAEMGKKHGKYQYKESGLDNVWLEDWPMFVCPDCDLSLPFLPDTDVTTRMITSALVRKKERLDGDSIVFLRKSMGLKTAELAQILDVNRVTISRWENDKKQIDAHLDFKIRMEAIDRILPSEEWREARLVVGLLFQRTYTHNAAMGDSTISVPAQKELELAAV